MNYKVKNILISDNGKEFKVGDDIAFTVLNKDTNHHDRYIGRIEHILCDRFVLNKCEVNRSSTINLIEVAFKDIEKNSCNHVAE